MLPGQNRNQLQVLMRELHNEERVCYKGKHAEQDRFAIDDDTHDCC